MGCQSSCSHWTLIPAALAPISLVGAWLAAGLAQPGEYDAVRPTISVLAGYAAADHWIMTLGLYAVSICQLVVAIGLPTPRPLARVLLVIGGLAGLGLAISPSRCTARAQPTWCSRRSA